MSARKLRFGMIGGGRGAFIGAVHRIAAQMDGEAALVAGAFASDPQRSRQSGADLCLPAGRVYDDFEQMAAAEAALPADQRLDFVVIVTPNDRHYAPARLFLESGCNVVLDKPLALDLAEALRLREVVRTTGKVLVLTHTYAGNAMVKQARDLVRAGRLGAVRKVVVEYSQGWLATPLESQGHKQALWRTDPQRSGAGGCVSDIGTHAEHLLRYVTGLRIEELCADLTRFVTGRRLDDDCSILLRLQGGAKGVLHCSQVSVGEENNLNLRVYGEAASLEWRQEQPDELIVKYSDRPREVWRRGNSYSPVAARCSRVPPGHPEGYLESLANLYREAFRAIRAEVAGGPLPQNLDFPTIDEGIEGMRFVEAAVASSAMDAKWLRLAC